MNRELKRYKKEVHYYLDVIWINSSNKSRSRTNLYKWLSIQMNINLEDTHVRKFDLEQCKQALKILKSKYKQMYGKCNLSKSEKNQIDLSKKYLNKERVYGK